MEAVAEFFTASELRCKCGNCNKNVPHEMKQSFLDDLDFLRECYGPIILTSAYRCDQHPEERRKQYPGNHYKGIAADIKVNNGHEAYKLMQLAFHLGFTGIALGNGFVHVDMRDTKPTTWTY